MSDADLTVEQYPAAIAEAQAEHDDARANSLYQAQLAALEDQQPGDEPTTDATFEYLSQELDAEDVDSLRSHWTTDDAAAEGVALAQALASDHPELARLADQFDITGAAALVLAEFLARKSGYSYSSSGTTRSQQDKPMTTETGSEISLEAFARGRKDFVTRIEAAQAEGNSRLADAIYADQLAWIGRVKGDQPIVGSGGRTV